MRKPLRRNLTRRYANHRPKATTGRLVRVRDARSARKLLAKILRQMQDESVNVAVARAIIYGCSVYVAIVETAEIEARIEDLETRMNITRRPHATTTF